MLLPELSIPLIQRKQTAEASRFRTWSIHLISLSIVLCNLHVSRMVVVTLVVS